MIELDEEIRQAANGAFESRNPVVLGYVGDDGGPHLSLSGKHPGARQGSTGGLGPQSRPRVCRRRFAAIPVSSLLYRSSQNRVDC